MATPGQLGAETFTEGDKKHAKATTGPFQVKMLGKEEGTNPVQYRLEVSGSDGKHIVHRRFNCFASADVALRPTFGDALPQIPAKSFFFRKNLLPGFMAGREGALGAYAEKLAQADPELTHSTARYFLGVEGDTKAPKLTLQEEQAGAEVPKIAIIYYSMYGHTKALADEIKAGIEASGCNCDIWQVPETLPDAVLKQMGAPPKADVPIMDHSQVDQLPQYDGFVFGLPTRFGAMCAQMCAFFDGTGQLWQAGSLIGKPAATFVVTGTQNGGQETTHLTALTRLAHQGMIYVPLGYAAKEVGQMDMDSIHGGSPYGASMQAGADGSRKATEIDLKVARRQGETFANTVKKLVD